MLGIIITQTFVSTLFIGVLLYAAYKTGVFVERKRAARFLEIVKLQPKEVVQRIKSTLKEKDDEFDEFRKVVRKQFEELEKEFEKENKDAEAVG